MTGGSTRRSGRVRVAVVALTIGVGLALLEGCSGGGPSPHPAPTGDLPSLLRRAALQPCPSTDPASPAAPAGLPDVTLACIGPGPGVTLSALRGKPTLVNVYGTWCGPCGREAGFLSQAAAADRGRVRFLGVDTTDTADAALGYAAATDPPAHYPLVSDPQGTVVRHYPPTGPPMTLFVDPSGTVVHVTRGPYASTAALQADVARYLGRS